MKKYQLLKSTRFSHNSRELLYRIQSLRDFGDIKCGDVGGYVESAYNLSHGGDCWIYDNACVIDAARISGNAKVYGYCSMDYSAQICDNAKIYGYAAISNYVKIYGNATVKGWVSIYGECRIYGSAILEFSRYQDLHKTLVLDHGYWRLIKRNGYEYLISNTLETVKL